MLNLFKIFLDFSRDAFTLGEKLSKCNNIELIKSEDTMTLVAKADNVTILSIVVSSPDPEMRRVLEDWLEKVYIWLKSKSKK